MRSLAAVYAELGKTQDALETLRRAAQFRNAGLDDGDWYVLGRIAEQYGLNDVAAGLAARRRSRRPAATTFTRPPSGD